MTWVAIGTTVVGGVVGAATSKGGSQSAEAKKEPWGPAQPYLEQHLKDNDTLRQFYQQNPFNDIQKQGYQGLLGDMDNFRQNTAPGLMDFANRGMSSNYQRTARERPGMAGSTQPTGGLLSAPQQPGQPAQGPFSVAPQTPYGQIDWNKANPWYKSPEAVDMAAKLAEEERLRNLQAQRPSNPFDQNDRII